MTDEYKDLYEQVTRISGVNPRKCMRCGKCTATCPSLKEMDYYPHEFVYMIEQGKFEPLINSKSLYRCFSCFACIDRCPRDVEPSKLVEALRLEVIRQQGGDHLNVEAIAKIKDNEMPQQAIVSALRKYKK